MKEQMTKDSRTMSQEQRNERLKALLLEANDATISKVYEAGYTIVPIPLRPGATDYFLTNKAGEVYGTMHVDLFEDGYPIAEIEMYPNDPDLVYVLEAFQSQILSAAQTLNAFLTQYDYTI